jgi:ATP synthase protein I
MDTEKKPPSLDALQREIEAATPKGDEEKNASYASSISKAMRLGTDLFAGVGVGGVIGYFADDAFGTSPILFIVFFFVGFAAGVRNIIRNATKV